MTWRSPAKHENKGYGLGLTWAGTEARPTKKVFFPETGNQKLETFSELETLFSRLLYNHVLPPLQPRLKGKVMSWEDYRHRCQVRVRFGDTDPYGIVYFVSYFRYIHRAIEEYLRSLGLPPEETFRNTQEGFGLPIVEAHGKFLRPSRYGDLLEVETRLHEARSKALIFHFRFFPPGGQELLAEGSATLVAISREWQAIPVPARVLARLAQAGAP